MKTGINAHFKREYMVMLWLLLLPAAIGLLFILLYPYYLSEPDTGEVSNAETYSDNILIKDCWFSRGADWPESECGILSVPEDYGKPEGRQVKLPFIIFKPETPDENTSPLVIAGAGGPGGGLGISESDSYTFDGSYWFNWYSSTVEVGRDLILIDNRGVGSSVPKLDCPEVLQADVASLNHKLDREEVIMLTKTSFGQCKKRLLGQGIDINQYNVINAAEDLEQLRISIGAEQLNVYGVSYGSRVALEYERQHPDSVRALILDGIYPQSARSFETMPRQNAEAIMRLVNKCQDDTRCNDQFGFRLAERFTDMLEKLDKTPVIVKVTSPIDYEPLDVMVTSDVLFSSIYLAMYDTDTISYLPKYMYSIFKGNTDYLVDIVRDYYVSNIITYSLDMGAYASYSCFDDIPFADFALARSELQKYPFQRSSNELLFTFSEAMCETWDVPVAMGDFKQAYQINTPVLIYSGELDPVTPAELADSVIKNSRKAWHVVWSGMAHGVMFSAHSCADWTAQEFLSDPEADPFVYECVEEKTGFRFVIQ